MDLLEEHGIGRHGGGHASAIRAKTRDATRPGVNFP
jgi:hypothetical protein